MSNIKFDKRNYRKHNEKNKKLIRKSLEECGTGRSIIVDSNEEIIAGNGVYEQAKAMNIPVKVIETDGTELIAVKRTDLQTEVKSSFPFNHARSVTAYNSIEFLISFFVNLITYSSC